MPSALRTLIQQSPNAAPTTRPKLPRSRIARLPTQPAAGVLHVTDGAHVKSVAAGAGNPGSGTVLGDLSGAGYNATWVIPNAQPVLYDSTKNGFDFSGLTQKGVYATIPAAVAASIWGTGAEAQYFGVTIYLKLPAVWNPSASIMPYFHWTTTQGVFNEPDLCTVGAKTTSGQKQLNFLRSLTTSLREDFIINVPDAALGKFAQISIWRDASGSHGRLTYDDGAAGTTLQADSTGFTNATNNFAACIGRVGFDGPYASAVSVDASFKYTQYFWAVENTRLSGRNFADVIAADWPWRLAMVRNGIYA